MGAFVALFLGVAVCPAAVSAQSFVDEGLPVVPREHRQTGSTDVAIATVSTRNDMVTGGDVLIRVDVAPGVPVDEVRIASNGQDVSDSFRPFDSGLLGLVIDLRRGENEVTVSAGGREASLTLTNWPVTGPVFGGPHQEPFVCMTHLFRMPVTGTDLGLALDDDCSIETRVDYVYRSTGGWFRPLPDLRERPTDLASTTTNEGRTVPYIVRIETGTINRAIYQMSILHDLGSDGPIDPWTRPNGWNGRLVYTFGGGCPGGWYIQGRNTGGVLDSHMLGQGYAVASSSLNVFGNNCDDLRSAETVMMVKERFVEAYGPPAHTIGWGCSGGSDQVHQIGDNYPGLLDGIVPACSFPSIPFAHTTTHSFGARLLYNYFRRNAEVEWSTDQQVDVAGFPSYGTFIVQATRGDRIDPREPGGVCDVTLPPEVLYHPDRNPDGARCTTYDHGVNAWGRDPESGFARRPLDNTGVQYGLQTLDEGVITKEQFLDLNEKIGGVDIDANFTSERTTGDRFAARRGYQTGRFLSGGGGLAETPIIDYRAYVDFLTGDPHMRFHGFSTRHRIIEKNGHADNHVMLVEDHRYGGFSTGSPLVREALRQMDRWLLNLAQDTSDAPRTERVVRAKPADLRDMCLTPDGRRIVEPQTYDGPGECNEHYPSHSSAYVVAGMPVANNIVICRLKPIDPDDYAVRFTPEEVDRLRRIFPDGVCDYDRPGHEQGPLLGTWLSFGPAGVER